MYGINNMVYRIMIEVDDKFEVDMIERYIKKQFGEPFYPFDSEELQDD